MTIYETLLLLTLMVVHHASKLVKYGDIHLYNQTVL